VVDFDFKCFMYAKLIGVKKGSTIMRKRKSVEEHDNPDRWVVSYADFITLLFAFFTTLYAISHVDLGKLERFTGSMKLAFKAAGTEAVTTAVIDGIVPVNYADISLEKEVRDELGKFAILEEIAISREQRGVLLSIGDSVLFDAGSSDLRKDAVPYLASIAALIRKSHREIVIEGHTDNIPLRKSRYDTNLELATVRAARVYSHLVTEESINPDKLCVSGYGELRPIASNATPEGRARNRRVDILFVSRKDAT
jgi:chemotaxis protein MotB